MTIKGIYIAAVPGVRDIVTDTNITQTLTACPGADIYIVLDVEEEYLKHHSGNGDEYTTTYIANPQGVTQPQDDVGIVSDISQIVNDPDETLGHFAGSLGSFIASSIGTWIISYIKWNFDHDRSSPDGFPVYGYIYPNIAIEVLDCNTTTSTTSTTTSTTTTSTTTSTTTTTTTLSPPTPTTGPPCCWDCEKTLACFGTKPPIKPPVTPALTTVKGLVLAAPPALSPVIVPLTPVSNFTTTTTTTTTVAPTTPAPTTPAPTIITCPVDCNTLGY